MSFARELKSATGKVSSGLNQTWRRSVVEAFTQTVARTPVDTGVARNSWLLGQSNDGGIGSTTVTIDGQEIPDVGGSVLLYSNLPYIELLENGYSAQAPQGMVKITVNQWPSILRSNAV